MGYLLFQAERAGIYFQKRRTQIKNLAELAGMTADIQNPGMVDVKSGQRVSVRGLFLHSIFIDAKFATTGMKWFKNSARIVCLTPLIAP
jgi:hypothetical protein